MVISVAGAAVVGIGAGARDIGVRALLTPGARGVLKYVHASNTHAVGVILNNRPVVH
jgi:hypothetical protein